MKLHYHSFYKNFIASKWIDGAMHLIYPNSCLVCENEIARSEQLFCSSCYMELHFTHFESFTEPTELDQLFWGRVSLHSTYSLLYYEKTNSSQPLLKALKYKQRADVGRKLGELLGKKIQALEKFHSIDALIPVPIHPKKEFTRGYNQSRMIAEGISNILSIPVHLQFLRRVEHSKSQTTLGRFNRWDNVAGKFEVTGTSNLKHIAIIDDVITTGATLESIILGIQQKFPEIQISVISLALTK